MTYFERSAIRLGFAVLAATPALALGQTIDVFVDVTQGRHPISPLVYGVNYANSDQARRLNLRVNRSGGNATTRYNWQQNCTSSGSDWYFFSHTEEGAAPSESVDNWVLGNNASTVAGGTLSMITVPIIGWVAKIQANREPMWSFSVAKYGPQQAVEPWHSDAGNGVKTNGTPVTGNDPNDANIPVSISYQSGWLQHLVNRFGTASGGGVAYYLLDNEPGLWQETHRDVHPTGATMQQLFDKQRDAALLIKQIDPSAQVCGPEEWGWLSYLYSGFDFQWLAAHGWSGTPPDRQAHGGMDQAPWLLQQFAAASASAGKRLLDVFTLHYYPQGNYGWEDVSNAAVDWRNRSTRSLWDPNYTDESWINQKIRLIPRMKQWVNQYYPGTKLGITEYNWGADNHISGAIAQADALGIMGRDGIDVANRWVCPPTNSVTFKAIQMYTNYDGANGMFGNTSVSCTTANPDTFSAFASQDGTSGTVKVMLVNKSRTANRVAKIYFTPYVALKLAGVYQLTSDNEITTALEKPNSSRGLWTISTPKQSITLVLLQPL